MAGILFDSVEKVSTLDFKFRWSGTGPYLKFLDGVEDYGVEYISPGIQEDMIVTSDDSEEPPALEVIDTSGSEVADQVKYPPFATIQWRGLDCFIYRIQQLIDAVWVTQNVIIEDRTAATGFGYRRWASQPLVDGRAYQFRVIAEDENGNQGDPTLFTFTHIGIPAPPSITMVYDEGTGDLTTAARVQA
jgi:hypothetical protein